MRPGRNTESKQPHHNARGGKSRHKRKACMPRMRSACATRKRPRATPGRASEITRNDNRSHNDQPNYEIGSCSRPSAPNSALGQAQHVRRTSEQPHGQI
ncbi:hypothetical protein V6N13_016183 [Hibiscus sabdariffa]